MSQEWYYIVNGTTRGPITTKQLTSRTACSRIRRSDLVWREGFPDWVEAGELPWLSILIPKERNEADIETKSREAVIEVNRLPDDTPQAQTDTDDFEEFCAVLLQIWQGKMSLALTFWGLSLVAVIAFFAFGFLIKLLPMLLGGIETLQGASVAAVCVITWTIINVYVSVSIWRSAGNSTTAVLWRLLARACVIPLGAYAIYNLAFLAATAGIVIYSFISDFVLGYYG